MNETVNPDETIALQQRRCFRRIRPAPPRNRSFSRLLRIGASWFGRLIKLGGNWLGILRKLLAFSGPNQSVASGRIGRGDWAVDLTWIPHFYYRLLPIVIASGLNAIFLAN